MNAPAGGYTSDGNSVVIYQLRIWWKTHKQGRVLDSNGRFFLRDTSSYSPDAAYIRADQLATLTSRDMERFLRLCPAFVIARSLASSSMQPTSGVVTSF